MLNDLVYNIIENRDTIVITNGLTQEQETFTTMLANDTTLTHCNSDTSATWDSITLPTVVTTDHTTQPHFNHNTDTTQIIDQLQVIHEKLGKKLQH